MNKSSEQNPDDGAVPEQLPTGDVNLAQLPPHIPVSPQNSHQRHRDEGSHHAQSQRQHLRGVLGVDEIRAIWKLQIASAQSAWDKLTEYELIKSEGHKQKLADLVRGRYVISRHEADKQVKRFFNEHES